MLRDLCLSYIAFHARTYSNRDSMLISFRLCSIIECEDNSFKGIAPISSYTSGLYCFALGATSVVFRETIARLTIQIGTCTHWAIIWAPIARTFIFLRLHHTLFHVGQCST
jgi:hypothetical protein